jgi:hypothetical protein
MAPAVFPRPTKKEVDDMKKTLKSTKAVAAEEIARMAD